MRWFTTAGGLLTIMLLMTSCILVDGTIKVEDDGSGSVDFLTAVKLDVLSSVFRGLEPPDSDSDNSTDPCAEFEATFSITEDAPANATITPYTEDGFCGSRVTYDFGPSDDATDNIRALLDPTTRLYKEGDSWFFESGVNSDDIAAAGDDDALLADASVRLVIDLPGRAVQGQNNATTVEGDGRFVWNIDVLDPPARLFAQTEPGAGGGSGGGGLSPLLIGAVVALLAAAAGFFLWNKNNGGSGPDLAGVTQPDAGLPGAEMTPGTAATMPVVDGPAITATPPGASLPVVPGPDAMKETVILNAADIQQSIQDAAAPAAVTADQAHAAAADVAAAPEPVFDETLNAWVVDDPTRGRLRHDPATDTWNPA